MHPSSPATLPHTTAISLGRTGLVTPRPGTSGWIALHPWTEYVYVYVTRQQDFKFTSHVWHCLPMDGRYGCTFNWLVCSYSTLARLVASDILCDWWSARRGLLVCIREDSTLSTCRPDCLLSCVSLSWLIISNRCRALVCGYCCCTTDSNRSPILSWNTITLSLTGDHSNITERSTSNSPSSRSRTCPNQPTLFLPP